MEFESLKGLRLQGIAKAIHKFFLIITFPLRRGFLFLGLLLVFVVAMAAIPMSQGVSYKHIVDWYLLRYDEVKTQTTAKIKSKPEAIERKLKNKMKKEHNKEVKKEKRKEFKFKETAAPDRRHISDDLKKKMAAATKQNVSDIKQAEPQKRKTIKIKQSSGIRDTGIKKVWKRNEEPFFANLAKKNNINPTVAPIKATLQLKPNPVVPDSETIAQMPEIKQKLEYRKIDTLPLTYEEKPEHIEGNALILGPNDLIVGDKYIILYGIYTDAGKQDYNKANVYLKELADKKTLECEIVAYTYQNHATAICFLDGMSINQNLVDAGFATDVAL